MKVFCNLTLLLLSFVCDAAVASTVSSPAQSSTNAEEAAIVQAWEDYRRSLIERDGVRAVSLVTPASVADYDRLRNLALTLYRPQLRQADTLDRYMVLMLRSRLPGAELRGMSGSDLFRMSVEKGWVVSSMPSRVKFKRTDGAVAYLSFMKDGSEVPGQVPLMRRIGGRWFVDVLKLLRLSRPALLSVFSKLADANATDVNGAMLLVIAQLIGSRPPESVWEPPS